MKWEIVIFLLFFLFSTDLQVLVRYYFHESAMKLTACDKYRRVNFVMVYIFCIACFCKRGWTRDSKTTFGLLWHIHYRPNWDCILPESICRLGQQAAEVVKAGICDISLEWETREGSKGLAYKERNELLTKFLWCWKDNFHRDGEDRGTICTVEEATKSFWTRRLGCEDAVIKWY